MRFQILGNKNTGSELFKKRYTEFNYYFYVEEEEEEKKSLPTVANTVKYVYSRLFGDLKNFFVELFVETRYECVRHFSQNTINTLCWIIKFNVSLLNYNKDPFNIFLI